MSDVKLGQLIDETAQRDAIHIAIAPLIADSELQPGQRFGIQGDKATAAYPVGSPVGIVDPFLQAAVKKGERFYGFLMPNTVTGMRHEWRHPAFEPEACAKDVSEKWLREYAKRLRPYDKYTGADSYRAMMESIRDDYEVFAWGTDLHGLFDLEDADEFFHHLSVVLGRAIDRHSLTYSCSC